MGYVSALMHPPLTGPYTVLQRASRFTREYAKSSLGFDAYALSNMVGHMSPSRDFYSPFGSLRPCPGGLGDCESLYTHLKTKKMIADNYSARHFSRIQEGLGAGGLGNLY